MKTTVDGKVQKNPAAAQKRYGAEMNKRITAELVKARKRRAAKRRAKVRAKRRAPAGATEFVNVSYGVARDALRAGDVVGDNRLGGREEKLEPRDPLKPTAYERRAHADLLRGAARSIEQMEQELFLLRAQDRVFGLFERLMGTRGGVMRPGGGDAEESFTQKLRAAAKHQDELGGQAEKSGLL